MENRRSVRGFSYFFVMEEGEVRKLGFDELSNTWNGGRREVVAYGRLQGCPRKFVAAGRLCG